MEASRKDQLATVAPGAIAASHPIAAVDELTQALERMSKTMNVLSPVAAVDSIMALHQVSLRIVKVDGTVDTNGNGPECYFDKRFCKPGEVALGKNALGKIMAAAGVQIASRRRLDDHSDPNYCEIEVVLAVRDFDGTLRQVIASKEMDLRPGAPETMKPEYVSQQKTGRMVAQEDTAIADKRRHIQSHAETKAIERGLRLMFSLRQKYTTADLAKPFVIPKLVSNLDPKDPEQKAALIAHALGGQAALFGPPAGEPVRRLKAAGGDYEEAEVDLGTMPEAPIGGTPADPAIAGQQAIPFDDTLPGISHQYIAEPEMPPEEAAAPLCGLPITEAMLAAADPTRVAHIDAIAKWIKHAAKKMPPDSLDALCQKLGTGLDPLTASVNELVGVIGAIKAEVARVSA